MPWNRLAAPLLVLAFLAAGPARADDAKPPAFEVTYAEGLHDGPVTARVYVMLGPPGSMREPRNGPDWMRPQPFFAVDAKDWKAGEPLTIGADAASFPGPLDSLKAGDYVAQAVVRLNPDTHAVGGEGNAYGAPVKVHLDPAAGGVTALKVDKLVPPWPFRETDHLKLVDIPSPLLSAFHKRPIRHRAAVILPEGKGDEKRPTLYIVPGFGGDHTRWVRPAYAKDLIRVVLSPDCGTGHHVFADSAYNGPRGKALVEELIPHIEQTYGALAEPSARLLNGHSSGGWSTLWLQVTCPDFFGGTWSTSPDPVDFRDFQRIDLYAPGESMFVDRKGERRPIARRGTTPMLWYDDFSRMEDVIGDGGQLHSFEAVFSPLDKDGRPRPLYDRKTGEVDPETARAWEAYDIRLILERNWKALGPKLAGKLHVYMGEVDTFYLEGATRLLGESLKKLGSDAVVEIFPGKDHRTLMDADLAARIDREIKAAVKGVRDGSR